MSRHNRRRTRGGSKFASSLYIRDEFDAQSLVVEKNPPVAPYTRQTELNARHWHNRYTAWQLRDKRQREEKDKLEAEQRRICGGEVGDDLSLCYRMLEYFVSLDYMDD
ncbi:hypothetical protein MMC16_000988 [Acarospora aff. strigata]|nr:hypothetical protein [Acarospora aff. strigata]